MRAQNRDLSVSPDGKAPEYVPTLRPARFRDDKELRSPAHDTSAELAACRASDTSAAGIPLSPSLTCDGERVGVRGSRELRLHADSVSRSKRAECARRTGIFPCRLMGKLPNTYRPLRPARFRDDKELRSPAHDTSAELAACRASDTSAAGIPLSPSLTCDGERVGVRGSRELRLHADSVSRSKRAECARRTGIFPRRLMGKLPNTYRPCGRHVSGTTKSCGHRPTTHPPNLQLAAHSTRALPESPSPHRLLAMGRGSG